MSLRAVKSPLAPKMTMVQGSTALRPESRRQVSNSSTWSVCSIEPDNGEQVAEIQQILPVQESACPPSPGRNLDTTTKSTGTDRGCVRSTSRSGTARPGVFGQLSDSGHPHLLRLVLRTQPRSGGGSKMRPPRRVASES